VAEELAELLSDWVLFVCTIGGGCWDLTKSGGAMVMRALTKRAIRIATMACSPVWTRR